MKKVKANLIFVKIVLVLVLVFAAGCKEDIDNNFPDPEGTIKISMTKDRIIDGSVYPGLRVSFNSDCVLYITLDNYFYCGPSHSSSMVNVGRVRGLETITRIPDSGYAKTLKVNPEYGYVLNCGDGTYARIYVVDWLSRERDTGAKIKYQYPWNP